jgi:NDP-sugar pyrophosphorylase family protein
MKAIILAGGLGNRLQPLTEIIPKPLLPIGEKAILEIQIEKLKKYNFNEIYVATNYKSEYIESFLGDGSRYGVKITISKEEKPLGTAGPLFLLKKYLDEPFIVMNGDILTLLNFQKMYEFALLKKTKLTVGIKKEIFPFHFGNIYYDGDYVTSIEEKPNFVTNILAGIYIMSPEIFKYIPENEPYGIDSLIYKMLENKDPISKYEINEYWLDIGRIEDYEKAQTLYKTHFK